MFETTFTYASATPLPGNLDIPAAIEILHNFETVMMLNPDCHSIKPIPPPPPAKGAKAPPAAAATTNGGDAPPPITYFEVEDDLPFMPKKLWSGGVNYRADFSTLPDGCDITVHAPGGFTSTNHWRIIRNVAPLEHSMDKSVHVDIHDEKLETLPEEDLSAALNRGGAKDSLHADTTSSGGWYVEIISDAKCPRAFVSIIKGFLKNSHTQLQYTYIDRARTAAAAAPAAAPPRPKMAAKRPTLGRRKSSVL